MRSKSPILSAIDNEMENLLNKRPFGDEDDQDKKDYEQQQKILKNYHMPANLKAKMSKTPMNRKNNQKKQ